MTSKRNTRTSANAAETAISDDNSDELNLNNLSQDGKIIVAAITAQLDLFRAEFLNKLNEKDKEIDNLKIEVNTLKVRLANMEEKIDDADAYERRDTLIFSGDAVPQVKTGENCRDIVCNLVKDKLNLQIASTDISTSHRLGKKPEDQRVDKRHIIVKLCRRDLKRDLISACKQLKPDLFVNENLTPLRNTIMYALRKIKGHFPNLISGSASIEGRVFVWVNKPPAATERKMRIPINTKFKLEDFCNKFLNTPLDSIIKITNWPYEI